MPNFGSEVPHWLDELEEATAETHEIGTGTPSTVEVVSSPTRTCLLMSALLVNGVAAMFLFIYRGF